MKYTFTSVLKEIPKQNRTKDADQEQYLHEARNNANLTYSDIVHLRKIHKLTSKHVTGSDVVSLNNSEQMKYENSKAFTKTRRQDKSIILGPNVNLTYLDIVHFRKFHELTSEHVTGNYVVSLNSSEQMKYENSQAAFLFKAFKKTRSQEKNIILEDFMKMVNIYREIRSSSLCDYNPLGLVARKPVFGVSDKVRFKPACSATETS